MTGALDRASALFDQGKYAKAKELLEGFIAAPPPGLRRTSRKRRSFSTASKASSRTSTRLSSPPASARRPGRCSAPRNGRPVRPARSRCSPMPTASPSKAI